MKRILSVLLLSLFAGSCATYTPPPQDSQHLLGRALEAMGSAGAVASLKTLTVTGTAKFWEPEQSLVPGGEMRFASESAFEMTRDLAAGTARVDWVKNFVYPTPRTFRFSEIVTPGAGYVIGIDSNSRTRQSLAMKPPAHAMSGLRLAATQRELHRASPWLYQEMRHNPDRVRPSNDIVVDGVAYPAMSYDAGAYTFIVAFDPETGLPARIRTLDYDGVWGDVNYDLVLSDWRTMGGVRFPARQKYELNGRVVVDTVITGMTANPQVAASRFSPPPGLEAGAAPAARSVPYQWVLRRQFIGIYMDSDNTSFDTRAASSLRLAELAPGVQHQTGGTHNSLVVEMSDHLIVFDAPVSDAQSNWTIAAAKARYPGKPVRYLVLTHHHMDHVGGLRAYAAEGATLVVGKGAADHFRKVLMAPYRRNPDIVPPRDLGGTRLIEVEDKQLFSDGKRQVWVYRVENPHAAAMLMGYVADARIAYVTDLYSPGTPLPPKANPALASVVNAVKRAGIQPLTFAGGHGSTAPYAPLAALAGK